MKTILGDLTEDEIGERCRRMGLQRSDFIRPEWATHRIIYCLDFSFGPWPEEPPSCSHAVLLWLDRSGNLVRGSSSDSTNGRPRDRQKRIIDLRVGDEMLLRNRWAKITEIVAWRANWLTAEEAANTTREGYVYELTGDASGQTPAAPADESPSPRDP